MNGLSSAEIEYIYIIPVQDKNQNKYVRFTLKFNLNPADIYLMFSDTAEIWEVDYDYYAKKEIWLNDNWYIQYIVPKKG